MIHHPAFATIPPMHERVLGRLERLVLTDLADELAIHRATTTKAFQNRYGEYAKEALYHLVDAGYAERAPRRGIPIPSNAESPEYQITPAGRTALEGRGHD